jgi:hypothetical protein
LAILTMVIESMDLNWLQHRFAEDIKWEDRTVAESSQESLNAIKVVTADCFQQILHQIYWSNLCFIYVSDWLAIMKSMDLNWLQHRFAEDIKEMDRTHTESLQESQKPWTFLSFVLSPSLLQSRWLPLIVLTRV